MLFILGLGSGYFLNDKPCKFSPLLLCDTCSMSQGHSRSHCDRTRNVYVLSAMTTCIKNLVWKMGKWTEAFSKSWQIGEINSEWDNNITLSTTHIAFLVWTPWQHNKAYCRLCFPSFQPAFPLCSRRKQYSMFHRRHLPGLRSAVLKPKTCRPLRDLGRENTSESASGAWTK